MFDWSTGLGAPGTDPDNGLGYMHCKTPLGPCSVAPTPVNSMKQNGGVAEPYVSYLFTLFAHSLSLSSYSHTLFFTEPLVNAARTATSSANNLDSI